MLRESHVRFTCLNLDIYTNIFRKVNNKIKKILLVLARKSWLEVIFMNLFLKDKIKHKSEIYQTIDENL